MSDFIHSYAPGWPGIAPRWTSPSAKSGAGTALNQHSKVWFTLSHGILNESIFSPGRPGLHSRYGLLVTDGHGFFSEEKRHCRFENSPFEPGIPAVRADQHLTTADATEFTRKFSPIPTATWCCKNRFEPLQGQLSDYRLYALLSPTWPTAAIEYRLGRRLQRPAHVLRRVRRHCAGDWAARRRGKKCRSASWALLTDGRTFHEHFRWSGNTSARKTAT